MAKIHVVQTSGNFNSYFLKSKASDFCIRSWSDASAQLHDSYPQWGIRSFTPFIGQNSSIKISTDNFYLWKWVYFTILRCILNLSFSCHLDGKFVAWLRLLFLYFTLKIYLILPITRKLRVLQCRVVGVFYITYVWVSTAARKPKVAGSNLSTCLSLACFQIIVSTFSFVKIQQPDFLGKINYISQ